MRSKKLNFHELPYTEVVKSGTIRLMEKVRQSGHRLYTPACVAGAYGCLPD